VHPLRATNPAFSGDFRRFAFTAVDARTPDKVALRVYEARFDGKQWSHAKPLQLLADPANSGEPMFSPDGQWLYFTSNGMPGAPWSDMRAYRARVTDAGYAPAERVPLDVPSTQRILGRRRASARSFASLGIGATGRRGAH
jgi:Tol biopolymer transport system component